MSLEEVLSLTPEELGKLPVDGGPRFNRLVFEKSPYLLQHALNPVDWYPWGEGAFHDEENGGFFFTAEDSEKLLVRKKEILDGALPSGNSVAALSLLKLGRLTARSDLEKAGTEVLKAFGGQITRSPAGFTGMMCAFDFLSGPTNEIVIAGLPGSEDVEEMLRALRRTYLPSAVVIFRPAGQETPDISVLAPYTLDQKEIDGKAAAYVCRDHACQLPVTSVEAMLENLTDMKPSRNG